MPGKRGEDKDLLRKTWSHKKDLNMFRSGALHILFATKVKRTYRIKFSSRKPITLYGFVFSSSDLHKGIRTEIKILKFHFKYRLWGQFHEIFASSFFRESSFSRPLIPLIPRIHLHNILGIHCNFPKQSILRTL